MCVGPCIILTTEEQNPTRCHLLLYYAYVRLNMFRAPLCPSSGAHIDSVGYHIGSLVLEFLLVGSGGCTAFGPDTHPSCLHLTSNQQQLENQTAYEVTNAIVVNS